jgi:hypothetical protein
MLGLTMLAAAALMGVVSLLGGAAMAFIRAPPRASRETLGPVLRIGWRRRNNVVRFLKALYCSLAASPLLALEMFVVALVQPASLVLGLVGLVVSFPCFG